jgi:nucleoside phosphorylase
VLVVCTLRNMALPLKLKEEVKSKEEVKQKKRTLDAAAEELMTDIDNFPTQEQYLVGSARQTDFLVFAVNDNEWQAALRFITFQHRSTVEGVTYFLGHFNAIKNASVVLVRQRAGAGAKGAGRSQDLVSRALQFWSPRLVVAIGCAMGVDPEKHRLDDVLFSSCIAGYECVRRNADQTLDNRNDPCSVSGEVLALFNEFIQSGSPWRLARKGDGTQPDRVCVHAGAIMCGESLVADDFYKKSLLDLLGTNQKKSSLGSHPIIGGEMEGIGMFAACDRFRLPCVVIKGVSDHAGNKQQSDKARTQRRATFAAFDFLVTAVKPAFASGNLPHFWAPERDSTRVRHVHPVDTDDPAHAKLLDFVRRATARNSKIAALVEQEVVSFALLRMRSSGAFFS